MAAVPSAGQVIQGRFRLEAEIGRGGMGVVLRGRDPSNRAVAIKILLPEAVESGEAVERFVNEARAARELTSEHVARVFEAGTLDVGLPFMVMELLEGDDLASLLEKRGAFAIPDACDAIIDASHALAEAHARGMVHRDLKPANLFAARCPDGRTRVKVLDFGLSKVAAQMRQAALTSTGVALGTPHYMAPEQLKSAKGADLRADIWSLGVVLYELLTTKVPFDGRSFGMLFAQVVSEEPTPLARLRPDVPPELAEAVHRCLRKEREERFPNLFAFVAVLAKFASPAGAATAARIIDGRGQALPARESQPVARPLGGTLLMPQQSPFRHLPPPGSPAPGQRLTPAPPAPPAVQAPANLTSRDARTPATPAPKGGSKTLLAVLVVGVFVLLVVGGAIFVVLTLRR